MIFIADFFLMVLFLSVAELFLLVRVSAAIGFLPTLGMCALTGILGGALVRHQGLRTIGRMQNELAAGRLPAGEVLEGVILILCGALLCVPGFITDAFGFLMLIPPVRRKAVAWLKKKLSARVGFTTVGFDPRPRSSRPKDSAIDVEFEEVSREEVPPENRLGKG